MIRGLPASPGAACGTIVFNAADAQAKCKDGPVILLREETSPDDITGMHVAKGVVTARGGMTSHAIKKQLNSEINMTLKKEIGFQFLETLEKSTKEKFQLLNQVFLEISKLL